MRKPQIDYIQFRLGRINEPRFSHLKLLFGWVGYFALYYLTEKMIRPEDCHVMHCALDDMIPFCEAFVVPYVAWYGLIVFCLVYFALYDVESFRRLMKYIIVTQLAAMAIYILFPNMQDLRPETFPRKNIFTAMVSFLYTIDTNTNVCPSLHVAYSLGIASVWLKREDAKLYSKLIILVFIAFVCLATVFIKQHSVLDGLAALPVCIMAEYIVFWKGNRKKKISHGSI